ncbi:MAG: carbamoyltransferase C-terminal domain-containing protein [Geminicoccaceae bacterium]
MRVLGIGTGADSGAAIVEDGRILAAVNEERICRWKLAEGFPRDSIRDVLGITNTETRDLDLITIGGRNEMAQDQVVPFDGWFTHYSGVHGALKRSAGHISRYRNRFPFLERAYYLMQEPSFIGRRRLNRRILQEEFGVTCPILFIDHHLCHVASAYFTSGFKDALAVSADGGGDRLSALVYEVRRGQWRKLHQVSAYNSLGNYYAYVTTICGFTAMKHEGKITGLAAQGRPIYLDLLRQFIEEEDGTFINRGELVFRAAIEELRRRLPADWRREDLAASVQAHFEDIMRRFVSHWTRRTKLGDVALAGGVTANVRVNEEIHRLPEVNRVFIHPHMGDGGLPVGAALAACIPGVAPATMRSDLEPLKDVYLGRDLADGEIEQAMRAAEVAPQPSDGPLAEQIGDLLVRGHVVARASGRMEYGPRALGNRSILYQPTDPSVNDWLNHNLRRTEFMPFAPATLWEERERLFEQVAGAEHPAEFMTITFHCNAWAREHLRGVVHLDGTARLHLVRRDRNPGFYAIIEAFRRRTGLPAIINTSFNMHEEPIVYSASDAVRAFLDGNLDYLALGPHLIEHPRGITHELHPVAARVQETGTVRHGQARQAAGT